MKYLAYDIYVHLVGIFGCGTCFAMICEVDDAVGYVLSYICHSGGLHHCPRYTGEVTSHLNWAWLAGSGIENMHRG